MINRIKKLINEVYINEESLDRFIQNQSWVRKLIRDSIKEQELSSDIFDKYMIYDFKGNSVSDKLANSLGVDVDDLEDEDIVKSDVYKEFVYFKMSNRIMDIYYDIYHIIKENKIELFRALDIKGADWVSHLEKQGKHLGVYWADSFDKAEAHWGTGGKTYIIQTSVDEKNVNWYDTFMARMDLTLGDEEREIRLFKGTPLKLLNLYLDGEELNISNIKDKIFYA